MDDVRRGPSEEAAPIRWLLLAATLGLALRLAFGLLYWTDEPLTRDEQEYLSLSRSLTRGQGFIYDDVLTASGLEPFGRAPGYPAFLALAGGGLSVSPSVPLTVKVAQSLAGAFGVIMVGLIAGRLAGRQAAVVAASGAAVYPPLVWIAGYALSEALFWPIGLLTAWLFDRALSDPARARAAVTCGLVLGAATLIRPALVLFVPFAALLLLHRRQPLTLAGGCRTGGRRSARGPTTPGGAGHRVAGGDGRGVRRRHRRGRRTRGRAGCR
jgi:4-amino-4-deoxy-L-arabinose transferase-like glycosyltransferase